MRIPILTPLVFSLLVRRDCVRFFFIFNILQFESHKKIHVHTVFKDTSLVFLGCFVFRKLESMKQIPSFFSVCLVIKIVDV